MASYFEGKVALVTGGSSGIGLELCRQLLARGASVAITGRDNSKLQKVREEFQNESYRLYCIQADMRDAAEVKKAVGSVTEKYGRLDLLIANAGSSGFAMLEHSSPEMLRSVIDTNIYGTIFPLIYSLPALKASRGRLILISSLAGLHGLPEYSSYSLSKMALRALHQSLRIELKGTGVKSCLCLVGFTENEDRKVMLDAGGNPVAVPRRSPLLQSSRKVTAARILFQLKYGIPLMSTARWGFIYRALAGASPGALNWIMRKFYSKP